MSVNILMLPTRIKELILSGKTKVISSLSEETEIDLAKVNDLITTSRTQIQEKRVSQVNFNNGYIDLAYEPENIVSVVIAGGTAQYGSYDPDDASFEPDYYIDANFDPARLIWKRTWSDNKEFALSEVIQVGDKIIITYNRKIV